MSKGNNINRVSVYLISISDSGFLQREILGYHCGYTNLHE
ncbi:unnamed protein product [Arabidopsis halleri]